MTMGTESIYIVVNEGASEKTYLQTLRSFLANQMPLSENYCPRLNLIPRVTNNGIGGGAFTLVRKAYETCRRMDRSTPIIIWVDADIYVRGASYQEKHNVKSYASRTSLPDFHFSIMNFEDFLALHFDDDVFEDWYETMKTVNHFQVPLTGKAYEPLFKPTWQRQMEKMGIVGRGGRATRYEKGDLPLDFISPKTLMNLFRHTKDSRAQEIFRANTASPTFAEFLVSSLQSHYGETLEK